MILETPNFKVTNIIFESYEHRSKIILQLLTFEMTIFENKLKTKRKQGYSNLPFSVSAMLGCR